MISTGSAGRVSNTSILLWSASADGAVAQEISAVNNGAPRNWFLRFLIDVPPQLKNLDRAGTDAAVQPALFHMNNANVAQPRSPDLNSRIFQRPRVHPPSARENLLLAQRTVGHDASVRPACAKLCGAPTRAPATDPHSLPKRPDKVNPKSHPK
jgi:hypothetical protein